jgi:hypothetical protein
VRERRRAHGQHHEILDVDPPSRVRAAAKYLDLGQRQRDRVAGGQVAPQGQAARGGRGVRHCERHRDGRIAAEARLVGCSIERDQCRVDAGLIERIPSFERATNGSADARDGLDHVHSAETRAAIAQIDRLARAAGGAGGSDRAPARAAFEHDLGFERRPPARIPDAPRKHAGNRLAHSRSVCAGAFMSSIGPQSRRPLPEARQ